MVKSEPSVSCPACGCKEWVGTGSRLVPSYHVHQCRDCQLTYSDPMTPADSAWYASSWIYGLRRASGVQTGSNGRVPWNFAQALSVLPGTGGKNLLDVGCAEGYFLQLANGLGWTVTGVDFDPASIAIARKVPGVSAVYGHSVKELRDRLPGTEFDVVTMFEVLEHIADPYETLCSIHRLLRHGGKIILSVPGNRRWPALFHPQVDAPPHHLTLWTEEALGKLLQRAGFRVLNVRAKPLTADDLGIHLKWRLYHTVRRLEAKRREPDPTHEENSKSGEIPRRQGSHFGVFRELGMLGLAPACLALRLNPKAGGFTLFAHGEKA